MSCFCCSLSRRKSCCNLMNGRMTSLLCSSGCFVNCLLCSCLNCRLIRCVTVFCSWWKMRLLSWLTPLSSGLRMLCCGCFRRSCRLSVCLRLFLPCSWMKSFLWKRRFFSPCGLSGRGIHGLYALRPLCVKACDDGGAGRTIRGGDAMGSTIPNIPRSTMGHTILRNTKGRRNRHTNGHSNHIRHNTTDRRSRRSTMGHKNHNISMGGIPMLPNTDCSVCSNTMSFRCCTGCRCIRSTIRTDPLRQSLRCPLLPG